MSYDLAGKRVWVAGHRGLVGSSLVRRLAAEDCILLTPDRAQLDLQSSAAVEQWIAEHKPQAIFLAAAKVGGILANNLQRADFLYQNLRIELNVIHAAFAHGVEKLLFLGSSCIYPRDATQPIAEEALLTGPLEQTNEPYALAKIAGVKLCECYRQQYGCDFISAMPTNLYGPNDNFHPKHAHVPAALMSRFHDAKIKGLPEVAVWGTGTPRREFLFVDDLADACVFLMKNYSGPIAMNVGTGDDVTIRSFAEMIRSTTGYEGELVFDASYPDGTPRKVLDVSRLTKLGWKAKTDLCDGLARTYDWYCNNYERLRAV
ncbi:GDP-L-fucose synthase family protein [Rhodomicrobium lacus]|uniref:GDP-L-fucose synthase family protein n=1 Tax=Rhodomicrobium lacus TaxID=2498452 RepID=UPI0026E3FAB7|nr:GDP-L-fucose synthase [Rhodomicrobium lacus]WKW51458.1 GDP-L-fucose synthase [Rhodomicrobium lacus]